MPSPDPLRLPRPIPEKSRMIRTFTKLQRIISASRRPVRPLQARPGGCSLAIRPAPVRNPAPIPRAPSICAHSVPHPWQRSVITISHLNHSTYAPPCDTIRHFATDPIFATLNPEPRTLNPLHGTRNTQHTPISHNHPSTNDLPLIHVPQCPTMSHISFSLSLSPCPRAPVSPCLSPPHPLTLSPPHLLPVPPCRRAALSPPSPSNPSP